jgi:hypothetical protein
MGHAPEGSADVPRQMSDSGARKRAPERQTATVIAVVHLVWGPLGAARLRSFISSYLEFPAGVDHELVILFNGVEHETAERCTVECDGVAHRVISLAQPVQDLAAYARAAESLHHDRICFLNSYSVILAERWLAKLDAALDRESVGVVGATGSWGSFRSAALDSLRLPTPYRKAEGPGRRRSRELAREIDRELDETDRAMAGGAGQSGAGSTARGLTRYSDRGRRLADYLFHFPAFPAAHLRTNAFMAERRELEPLMAAKLATKGDALRFESGRESFTRRLEARGMRAVVVDRSGDCFDGGDWPASRTFWQRDQEGLMIADNRTLTYTNGALDRRAMLSSFAWGARAEPRAPGSR